MKLQVAVDGLEHYRRHGEESFDRLDAVAHSSPGEQKTTLIFERR